MKINRQDTKGVKPLLAVGELGYDNYPTGGDAGRVYVGNGSINIPQAKKSEVIAVDGKIDTHVVRVDNPHAVTKAQVGLGNVQDVNTTNASNITSGTLANARLANSGVTAGTYKSVTVDGKGIVTGGTNPTTISGYGITDAYTKTETYSKSEAVQKVASTDNAIVRFNGTTGEVQNSSVVIDDNGNVGIGTGSNINAKLDVVGSVRQYNQGTSANSVMNHVNDAKNWYVGLRGDSSNAYSIADETRQRFLLDVAGNTLHLSPNGGLGYGAGSGGTVTQLTSKSTAVTLNKPSGQITMNNAALAISEKVSFPLINNLISLGDTLFATVIAGSTVLEQYETKTRCANGVAIITVWHTYASSLSEPITIQYALIKGTNS